MELRGFYPGLVSLILIMYNSGLSNSNFVHEIRRPFL